MNGIASFVAVSLISAAAIVSAQGGARLEFPPAITGSRVMELGTGYDGCGVATSAASSTYATVDSGLRVVSKFKGGEAVNLTVVVFDESGLGPLTVSILPRGEVSDVGTSASVPVTLTWNLPGPSSPAGPVPRGISFPFAYNVVATMPRDVRCSAAKSCILRVQTPKQFVSCAFIDFDDKHVAKEALAPGYVPLAPGATGEKIETGLDGSLFVDAGGNAATPPPVPVLVLSSSEKKPAEKPASSPENSGSKNSNNAMNSASSGAATPANAVGSGGSNSTPENSASSGAATPANAVGSGSSNSTPKNPALNDAAKRKLITKLLARIRLLIKILELLGVDTSILVSNKTLLLQVAKLLLKF